MRWTNLEDAFLPLEETYVRNVWNIMNNYKLESVHSGVKYRKFGSFRPDVLAVDRKTGTYIAVEVRAQTPILTNVVQALAYYKKRLPNSFFIAFSPLGTFPDVKEMADKEGILIVSALDELSKIMEETIMPNLVPHRLE